MSEAGDDQLNLSDCESDASTHAPGGEFWDMDIMDYELEVGYDFRRNFGYWPFGDKRLRDVVWMGYARPLFEFPGAPFSWAEYEVHVQSGAGLMSRAFGLRFRLAM